MMSDENLAMIGQPQKKVATSAKAVPPIEDQTHSRTFLPWFYLHWVIRFQDVALLIFFVWTKQEERNPLIKPNRLEKF